MHPLASAHDGVYRAYIQTLAATDTGLFVNYRMQAGLVFSESGVEGFRRDSQQVRDRLNRDRPAWGAVVDIGLAGRDPQCIFPTTRIPAVSALSLRQPGIDFLRRLVRQRERAYFLGGAHDPQYGVALNFRQ